MPGVLLTSFIWAINFSQVIPGRHWFGGLSCKTVSNMDNGAGSVGVSAWPALPKTLSTSGNFRRIRSWICKILVASVTDIPGMAVGMLEKRSFVERRHELLP